MGTQRSLESWQHRYGVLSSVIVIVCMLVVPFGFCRAFGITLNFGALTPLIAYSVAMMCSFTIGEVIAYTPLLGPGSMYMCYITGNVTNQKIPCTLSALNIAGVERGSDQASAVSMVAVGVSSFTSMLLIFIGLMAFRPLTPILSSPVFTPMFNNVLPAIVGGLLGGSIIGNVKNYILPLVIAAFCAVATNLSMAAYMLITLGVLLVVNGYLFYRNTKKEKAASGSDGESK